MIARCPFMIYFVLYCVGVLFERREVCRWLDRFIIAWPFSFTSVNYFFAIVVFITVTILILS